MQFSDEVFQTTVKYLENHEESLRIKKVIFCLCHKSWQNDLEILKGVSLGELITEILAKTSDFQNLKYAINKLINSLNNSDFYTNISEIILDQLELVYTSQDSPLSGVPTQPNLQQSDLETLIDSIIEDLTNHPEKRRIKKLMVSACQSKWEKDSGIVRQQDFRNLILELHRLNPQKRNLEKSLHRIVKKLNKPEVYAKLAHLVIDRLAILYETGPEPTVVTIADHSDQSELEIQEPKIEKSHRRSQTNVNKKFDLVELATSMTQNDSKQIVGNIQKVTVSLSEPDSALKNCDLFELRLEIMQYTNPLQAKMILFSILDQFWLNHIQDWSILKNFTLDYLLEQLFKMYRSKNEVQEKFEQVAPLLPGSIAPEQTFKTLMEILPDFI